MKRSAYLFAPDEGEEALEKHLNDRLADSLKHLDIAEQLVIWMMVQKMIKLTKRCW